MKHLAIGPGALGYYALLGAMNRLWDEGSLKDLESISGSSAGALVACMCALHNFDFHMILSESNKVPLHMFKPQIKSLLETYGFVSQDTIRDLVMTCIPDKTFQDLYNTFPKKMYISAHCVDLAQTQYFSVDTHPEMSIVDAVCMSISIPIMCSSFKYGPWTYFDVGMTETAHCGHLIGKDSVMILRIRYTDAFVITDLSSYLQLVFKTLLKMRKSYKFPTFFVDLGDTEIMDFQVDEVYKLKLFVQGYNFLDK